MHEAEKTAPSGSGGTTDESGSPESEDAAAQVAASEEAQAGPRPQAPPTDAPSAGVLAAEAPAADAVTAEGIAPATDTVVAGDITTVSALSGTAVAAMTVEPAVAASPNGRLSWLPFALQLLVWFCFAGVSAYLLGGATADLPARWLPAYGPLLWAGVALTVLGPLLALGVWLVVRTRREPEGRHGLLTASLVRSASVTLFGVLIWLTVLYMIDLHAEGRFL